ncbi:MAG: hypothetical protein RI885_1157 [Actinomycetota bacterium]
MRSTTWRERRAARRVRPGAGEPLPRFRWWQLLSRSLLTLAVRASDGTLSTYTVDVRRVGDPDGRVRARLYLDGALLSHSTVPARLPVPGGHIDVAVGLFGLRRCHYVRAGEADLQLTPHPASAEGRRAGLDREHPALSRLVSVVSTLIVLVGVGVATSKIVETISQIPTIAAATGTFDSPIDLPVAATIALALAAIVASMERALRLRSSWLDSLAS